MRPRLVAYLEKRWIVRWLGHAPPILYPKAAPSSICDILEPDENIPAWLVVPGRFTPLPGTKPDERGIKLAGYIEYGGADDPVIRGSLVRVVGSEASWRVMVVQGSEFKLLKSDRENPEYRKEQRRRCSSHL